MSRIAYFDCFSGASGDMCLGALIDGGLEVAQLESDLRQLRLSGYQLHAAPVARGGLAGTQVQVELDGSEQPARRLAEIRRTPEAQSTLAGFLNP